jgi:HD-GYP domain-containing protein (c-di-GMP phosphodiesterase class II)
MVRVYEHERQTHYDRSVVERLIQCIGVYPIGTVVELNTGERGVVIA